MVQSVYEVRGKTIQMYINARLFMLQLYFALFNLLKNQTSAIYFQ